MNIVEEKILENVEMKANPQIVAVYASLIASFLSLFSGKPAMLNAIGAYYFVYLNMIVGFIVKYFMATGGKLTVRSVDELRKISLKVANKVKKKKIKINKTGKVTKIHKKLGVKYRKALKKYKVLRTIEPYAFAFMFYTVCYLVLRHQKKTIVFETAGGRKFGHDFGKREPNPSKMRKAGSKDISKVISKLEFMANKYAKKL
jgi:hypothetical protein